MKRFWLCDEVDEMVRKEAYEWLVGYGVSTETKETAWWFDSQEEKDYFRAYVVAELKKLDEETRDKVFGAYQKSSEDDMALAVKEGESEAYDRALHAYSQSVKLYSEVVK